MSTSFSYTYINSYMHVYIFFAFLRSSRKLFDRWRLVENWTNHRQLNATTFNGHTVSKTCFALFSSYLCRSWGRKEVKMCWEKYRRGSVADGSHLSAGSTINCEESCSLQATKPRTHTATTYFVRINKCWRNSSQLSRRFFIRTWDRSSTALTYCIYVNNYFYCS